MILSFQCTVFFILTLICEISCHPGNNANQPAPVNSRPAMEVTIKTDEKQERGKVIPMVTSADNPAYSFALFLPADYDTSKRYPAIIFFDPHGSGAFVITKYQHLAGEFSVILIASNDSKNGLTFDQTNDIASTLIKETALRYSIQKEITLCGFSGGARAALSAALQHSNVNAVIYAGAAMPLDNNSRVFSLLGFAGITDMNYTDLIQFNEGFNNSSYPHYLIEWKGRHEWPDSATFRDAFFWVTFNSLRETSDIKDQTIQKFLKENSSALKSSNKLKIESASSKTVYFLNGLTDLSSYHKQAFEIEQSAEYKKLMEEEQITILEEAERKKQYMEDFQTKDLRWWQNEISGLNAEKGLTRKVNQRLLGFISLAGFSVSNHAIQQNNFPLAQKMLAIYKLADPKNPDQPFLQACLYAKQEEKSLAIQSLNTAVSLGLDDSNKILNEPTLKSLRFESGFKEVIKKTK